MGQLLRGSANRHQGCSPIRQDQFSRAMLVRSGVNAFDGVEEGVEVCGGVSAGNGTRGRRLRGGQREFDRGGKDAQAHQE